MRDVYKTLEGTRIVELARKPTGTIGVFMCRFSDRNKIQARIAGEALRLDAKIKLTSYPIITDGKEDVQHVIFAEVTKSSTVKYRGYNVNHKKEHKP